MEKAHTGDPALVYNLVTDELTQHEMEKVLRLCRAVKRGELDTVLVQRSATRRNELYIVGLKRAA
jgi:hypothetical protein